MNIDSQCSSYKIVYTVRRGTFSVALEFADLGSLKHQTEAEVKDAIRVCNSAMASFKCNIAAIDVDNAARGMAGKVTEHYKQNLRLPMLVVRDASHTVDLLSKDLANTNVVKTVVNEMKEIHDLVRTDRINSMRLEQAEVGDLKESHSGKTFTLTRMNLLADYGEGALKQSTFIAGLGRDQRWKQFISERKPADKIKWEDKLNKCNDNKR